MAGLRRRTVGWFHYGVFAFAFFGAGHVVHAVTCGPATVNAPSVLTYPGGAALQSTIESSVCDQISQKFQTNSITQILAYMANAYAMASKGAIADYGSNIQVFTLGVGTTVGTSGIAIPTTVEQVKAIVDDVKGGGIPSYGAGVGVNATLGISFRHLPFKRRGFFDPKNFNVYLSGMATPAISYGIYSVQATAASGYVQYKILPGRKIPLGLITWGGLDIGLGYTYSSTKATISSNDKLVSFSKTITESSTGTTYSYDILYEPTGTIALNYTSHVIPFEISNNFSILYFLSFIAGGAMDYHILSSTSITANVGGAVNINKTTSPGDTASFALDSSGKINSAVFFRAFFGPQINIWKIRIYSLVHLSTNQNYGVTIGTRFSW